MGKAARWFRSILGKKDHPGPQRWSRDSAAGASNAAIARAAWLRSAETDREQSKHAIAVAAATAAAADAAVAAAQAAVAVVRLTSKGPVLATAGAGFCAAAAAAVRIQTAFRAFLAKKALRALKALVKLQALVRGYLVRRQAAATLQSMQALIRAQAAVRAHRAAALPPPPPPQLQLPPLLRPRYSLQDDTRSERGGGSSRRLSASVESSSTFGYDRSPKIVEVDPGQGRPKSRSSSRRASSPLVVDAGSSEEWSANSACSPLPCCHLAAAAAGPPRIAVRQQFPDNTYDWCAMERARPATAQSTPRYVSSFAPPTPAKSVAAGGYSPSLANHCCTPGYMSSTQSSEAKARSQSAPKQRPPDLACAARKRVPLSEVVVPVESARASLTGVHHRASCGGGGRAAAPAQEAFSFKAAVVGRMDRTLEVAGVENDRLAFLQRRW